MDAVALMLLGLAIVQFILLRTKYPQSRPLRLGLFITMFAVAGWRALQSLKSGASLGLWDGFTMSFFGIATVMELVAILRERFRQG